MTFGLSAGGVSVGGTFAESITFGPGELNEAELVSAGGRDVFVANLDNGTAANDPPVGNEELYTLHVDTVLSIDAPGVLGNDTDADDEALTAQLVTSPSHGLLNLDPDGSFTYEPTLGYTGPDSFVYRAHDGEAVSNPVTVHLTVEPGGVTPPTIVSQPGSLTVGVGTLVTIGVVATGTAPLSYQWRINGTAVPGATGPTISSPGGVTLADDGLIVDVVVSNAAGSVTSNAARLTVTEDGGGGPTAPTIVTQPDSLTVAVGTLVTVGVAATGTGPLSYQWRINGTAVPGETGPTISSPGGITLADDGLVLDVIVSNAAGSVTSDAATLNVVAN